MTTVLLATLFVFGLLVLVHELGHFLTAKAVGMRVDEFAIGFGPKLIQFRKGETLYSWRLIPLGGFNKIAGMDPDEEQDEKSFQCKPIWARLLVIVAGSAMNFILPVLLFFIIFLSNGVDQVSTEPIIGTVMPDKPAALADLQVGDRILAVNGIEIATWQNFVEQIQSHLGTQLQVKLERNQVVLERAITPEYDEKTKRYLMGVMPVIINDHPGFIESFTLSVKQTYLVTSSMIVGLGQMVTGKAEADVAGPIGVAQMAGQVAQLGFLPLLQFAAYLSLNLGLINLLPVPVLDGGHVVTLLIEGLRGKPMEKKSLQFIQMVGFALLLMLMVVATMKDLSRLKLF